jgi:putative copper resistance protein D
MLEVGLAGARFFHLACAIILFGGASFVLYARPDVGGSRRLALLPAILAAAALGALLSGVAWFVLTAANMSGALVGALDRETLSSVLWDTSFGLVWALRVPLMILILAVIWWRRASALSRRAIALLSFLAAILLASLAGVGHTQVHEGVPAGVHVTADAVHLLAAGAWLGGLLPLCLFLAPDRTAQVSNDEAVRILSRFSGMGYVAVAVLIASGSINSWFLIGSLPHLIDTSYGQLLLSKLGLFGLMLLLALSNRFRLVPAIAQSKMATGSERLLAGLRRQVGAELVLALFVVGIVSVLGTLSPAVHGS